MVSVRYLTLSSTRLTGALPSNLYNMTKLLEFSFENTLLSGTISERISNLKLVTFLDIGAALFTGTLPSGIWELSLLRSLSVFSNFLTGFVTISEGARMDIQSLQLQSNYLSGCLPTQLQLFRLIKNVDAAFNMFSGKIDFLFDNESNITEIEYLNLAGNAFSGQIPSSLFKESARRQLSVVVSYSNCFTGSVPSTVCHALNQTTLILDSVSSAPACDFRFPKAFRSIFKVIVGLKQLEGSAPACLRKLPALQTLHLSGNGLRGSLPTQISLALNDVSLASNALTGSIPFSWQQRAWSSLDLSDNRISGALSSAFEVNSDCLPVPSADDADDRARLDDDYYVDDDLCIGNSNCSHIDLSVNRISGRIPVAFRDAMNIDILDGNLFQCTDEDRPTQGQNVVLISRSMQ
jgi:hypothetical protein